jgi:hypothetical protein
MRATGHVGTAVVVKISLSQPSLNCQGSFDYEGASQSEASSFAQDDRDYSVRLNKGVAMLNATIANIDK